MQVKGQRLRAVVERNLRRTYYISALRGDPLQFDRMAYVEEKDYVGARGEETLNVMARVFELTEAGELSGDIYSLITKWAAEFGLEDLYASHGEYPSFTDPLLKFVTHLRNAGHGSRPDPPGNRPAVLQRSRQHPARRRARGQFAPGCAG